MVRRISDSDHDKVSAAIASAEAGTSGEILAVTAEQSDPYHDVGLHYAIAVLFLVLAVFAVKPEWLSWWWDRLVGWTTSPTLGELLTLLLGIALLKFLAILFIMKWMPLRLALTPGPTKTRRVRRRAIILFKTAAERRTAGRTGILIYLSMAERRAEIIGDEAITARTDPDTWAKAMTAMLTEVRSGRPAEGVCAAIEHVGRILAADFPRSPKDKNEIPDKLIEL